MNKVTITLELTYEQVAKVMAFLHSTSESQGSPVAVNNPLEDKVPTATKQQPVTKPTAGKRTKMPAFGRKQEDITAFEDSEENRVALLDEKLEEKERVLKEKEDEVAEIKESTSKDIKPKKPIWEL